MKKKRILFAGERKGRIFTPVITTTANKMTTTKLRKGEYTATVNGKTYKIEHDNFEGDNGWNLYNEDYEWCGSADTKKKLVQALKNL
jgi:hypothetical protein